MAEAAHAGYIACGKNLEALRTHVGRMSVLLELGLYREALDAGQVVLDALDGRSERAITPTREQSDLLTALVHQNRGVCYEYMGRYEDALGAYAVAEERYRALGMIESLGEILDNRGAILLLLGRGKEGLAAHEEAAAVFAAAELTLSHARALSNIGEANRQLADYRRSLDAFERARRLYDSLDALADEGLLLTEPVRRSAGGLPESPRRATPHRDGPRSCAGAMGHGLDFDRSLGVRRSREHTGRSRSSF
jgi:tetratricopeptide (TPR) repeat protein